MYCERFPLWRSISNLRYPTRHHPRSSPLYTININDKHNDLPNCLTNVQYRMKADDTHLTFASNNGAHLERALNEDLAKINECRLNANNLTLTKSKTEFMLIESRQRLQIYF